MQNVQLKIQEKLKSISKYKRPVWPYLVLIGFLIWACISLGNANAKYSSANEETTKRLDEVHRELDALRKDYSKFKTDTEVKQQKLQQQVSVKPTRSSTVQRIRPAGGCESYRDLIDDYAWPVETMLAICNAESGGNPNAINPTDRHATCLGSYGIFQISCDWYYKANLFDPATNVRLAYGKYLGGGLQPWINTARKLGII